MPPADPVTARIDSLVDEAMLRVREVTDAMEFETFQTGARVPRDLKGESEAVQEDFRLRARLALLRRLEPLWPGRRIRGVEPQVCVMLTPDNPHKASIFVEPLYVAGRYTKHVRGMSQTVFLCRGCRGRRSGCERCGGTRREVALAVEDYVKPPIVAATGARRPSFHGCGREDVDVRMLGEGRPFVVSVRWALRRRVDGGEVAREVERMSKGRVQVSGVRVVDRATASRITTDHAEKTYRALVRSADARDLPADAAERLRALAGAVVRQRTPERVEARRADLVRERTVRAVEVEEVRGAEAVVVLRTDPGTYVKELVSGDDGRTVPSVSSILGQPCACAELDVVSAGAAEAPPLPEAGESAPGTTL